MKELAKELAEAEIAEMRKRFKGSDEFFRCIRQRYNKDGMGVICRASAICWRIAHKLDEGTLVEVAGCRVGQRLVASDRMRILYRIEEDKPYFLTVEFP